MQTIAEYAPIFLNAATNGDLEKIHALETEIPYFIFALLKDDDYLAFIAAAQNGHENVCRHFIDKYQIYRNQMLTANDYEAFRWAAENGHLNILQDFIAFNPSEAENMVKAQQYYAYRWAAGHGHLLVLQYLESTFPYLLDKMLSANNWEAYNLAVQNKHWEVVQHIGALAPNLREKSIREEFKKFIRNHFEQELELIESIDPENYKLIINSFYEYQRGNKSTAIIQNLKLLDIPEDKLLEFNLEIVNKYGQIATMYIDSHFAGQLFPAHVIRFSYLLGNLLKKEGEAPIVSMARNGLFSNSAGSQPDVSNSPGTGLTR